MKIRNCLLLAIVVFYTGCSKRPALNDPHKVSISSIAPSSGPAGTTVIIKGANFGINRSDNIVRFNKDSATVLTSANDSLVVVAPAKGSTGPVSVTVAGSVATGPVFTYTIDSVDVFVAAPAFGVVYWKNGQEIFLASTQSNFGGAYGIAISDTDVYVGGYTKFFNTFPSSQGAYWKNGKKTLLSSPNSEGEIRSLVISGGDLYAGGSEDYRPAYWKNGIKHGLPIFFGGSAGLNALAIDGNDVYAAGFEPGPGNELNLVYWKNGVETVLGKNGLEGGASSIAVKGNDVYVCGSDSGYAVYWKNGVRTVLEKIPPAGAPITTSAIAIAANSIYVVGSSHGEAVYWKDGTRVTLPRRGNSGAASAITFYQSDIYIGGQDGGSPVYWKNGVEVSLCCGLDGIVSAIAVVKKR